MAVTKLKLLKKGEFFTRKPIENPSKKQVLIRGEYIRGTGKYEVTHWDDVNNWYCLNGETLVYIGFTF